jgi:uncharacterized protein
MAKKHKSRDLASTPPEAIDPAAIDPAAVEPAAVEPAAVEPAAVEPAAVEFAPEPAAPALTGSAETPAGPAPVAPAAPGFPPYPPAPPRTISVGGTGRAALPPDIATVTIGVVHAGETVAAVRAEAAVAMHNVLGALREAGVAARDLRTSGLTLGPRYEYPSEGGQKLVGYELRNTVVARLRDLDRVSDAIDGALGAGATSLDGLTFDVEDRAAAEASAREAAVADALAKAGALARAAGATLGPVLSISEGSPEIPMPRPQFRMAAMAASNTPVEAGEGEIVVSVDVTVAIA